jgi:hypothetical protein
MLRILVEYMEKYHQVENYFQKYANLIDKST